MSRPRTVDKLFALQSAVLADGLARSDVVVLAALGEYMSGFHGRAWPSVETLTRVTGRSRRSVQTALRRLEAHGFVTIDVGGGAGRSNRYVVRFDKFTASPFSGRIKQAADEKAQERAQLKAQGTAPFGDPADDIKGRNFVPKGRKSLRERAQVSAPEPYLKNPSDLNPSESSARLNARAMSVGHGQLDDGATLAIVERAIKNADVNLDHGKALDAIDEILERHDSASGDSIGGWAFRLRETLLDLTDEADVEN